MNININVDLKENKVYTINIYCFVIRLLVNISESISSLKNVIFEGLPSIFLYACIPGYLIPYCWAFMLF